MSFKVRGTILLRSLRRELLEQVEAIEPASVRVEYGHGVLFVRVVVKDERLSRGGD
jgi:hypothetical protein